MTAGRAEVPVAAVASVGSGDVGRTGAVHPVAVLGRVARAASGAADDPYVARGMYALDPDGISVELFQEYSDIVAR